MIHVAPDGKGIVWIASYPKSGNTWIRVFLYHLVRILNGIPREDNELNKLDRASMYEGRLFDLYAQLMGKPVTAATPEEIITVRPRVHAAIVERAPGVTLVKTHNVLGQIYGVPIVNLAVSIGSIYVVRDPRDVALSLAHHLGSTVDKAIEVMATPKFATGNTPEGVAEVWGSWGEHVYSWAGRPDPAALVVRYEDMIADPVTQFTAIAHHLRQKPPAETIAEAVSLSGFENLAAAERENDFRERSERADRFFRSGRAGEWREKLSEDQARRVVQAHHKEMRQFGYLADD